MGLLGKNNINALTAMTERQRKQVKQKANIYVRGKVVEVLKAALKVSPAWSGNYAYNWQIEHAATGKADYQKTFKVEDWRLLQKPWRVMNKGDKGLMQRNLQSLNKEAIDSIKYNSKIKLVNYAPVAEMIEQNQVKLRPESAIPGDAGVMSYLKAKYKFIR